MPKGGAHVNVSPKGLSCTSPTLRTSAWRRKCLRQVRASSSQTYPMIKPPTSTNIWTPKRIRSSARWKFGVDPVGHHHPKHLPSSPKWDPNMFFSETTAVFLEGIQVVFGFSDDFWRHFGYLRLQTPRWRYRHRQCSPEVQRLPCEFGANGFGLQMCLPESNGKYGLKTSKYFF